MPITEWSGVTRPALGVGECRKTTRIPQPQDGHQPWGGTIGAVHPSATSAVGEPGAELCTPATAPTNPGDGRRRPCWSARTRLPPSFGLPVRRRRGLGLSSLSP